MCGIYDTPSSQLDPDPNDPRAVEVREALRGTLRDGELFVVFRAGAEVGAKRFNAPWLPIERGLPSTHPDLYGHLLAVEGEVERGYGWGPTLGVWSAVMATLVLIQTGWLAQVLDAAKALDAMKSGWFYFALLIFGGLVVTAVNGVFTRRALKQQVPRLQALAAANGFTEAELLTRISSGGWLWQLQQKLVEHPRVWIPADES